MNLFNVAFIFLISEITGEIATLTVWVVNLYFLYQVVVSVIDFYNCTGMYLDKRFLTFLEGNY